MPCVTLNERGEASLLVTPSEKGVAYLSVTLNKRGRDPVLVTFSETGVVPMSVRPTERGVACRANRHMVTVC